MTKMVNFMFIYKNISLHTKFVYISTIYKNAIEKSLFFVFALAKNAHSDIIIVGICANARLNFYKRSR